MASHEELESIDIDMAQWRLLKELLPIWHQHRGEFTTALGGTSPGVVGILHGGCEFQTQATILDLEVLADAGLIRKLVPLSHRPAEYTFGITPLGQRYGTTSGPPQWRPSRRPITLTEFALLVELVRLSESSDRPALIRIHSAGNHLMSLVVRGADDLKSVDLASMNNLDAWGFIRIEYNPHAVLREPGNWGVVQITVDGKKYVDDEVNVAHTSAPDSFDRQITAIAYGNVTITAGDGNSINTVYAPVTPGNLTELHDRLSSLGVRDEDLQLLDDAIEADKDESGEHRIGERINNWMGQIAVNAAGEAVALAGFSAATNAGGNIGQVVEAIRSFMG